MNQDTRMYKHFDNSPRRRRRDYNGTYQQSYSSRYNSNFTSLTPPAPQMYSAAYGYSTGYGNHTPAGFPFQSQSYLPYPAQPYSGYQTTALPYTGAWSPYTSENISNNGYYTKSHQDNVNFSEDSPESTPSIKPTLSDPENHTPLNTEESTAESVEHPKIDCSTSGRPPEINDDVQVICDDANEDVKVKTEDLKPPINCIDLSSLDCPEEYLNSFRHESKAKVLQKLCGSLDENKYLNALKQLKLILEQKMSEIMLKGELMKLLAHYLLFLARNYRSLDSGFVEEYLETMEDVLVMYFQVVRDYMHIKKRNLHRLSIRIKILMMHCLFYRMDSICHCLFKVRLYPFEPDHCLLWTDIFMYFIRKVNYTLKRDDYVRSYLGFQIFKTIRSTKEQETVDSVMYKRLKKSREELRSIPLLKEFIDKSASESRYSVTDMLRTYWNWWKKDRSKDIWADLTDPTLLEVTGSYDYEIESRLLPTITPEPLDEVGRFFDDRKCGRRPGLSQLASQKHSLHNSILDVQNFNVFAEEEEGEGFAFLRDDDVIDLEVEQRIVDTLVITDSDDDDDVIPIESNVTTICIDPEPTQKNSTEDKTEPPKAIETSPNSPKEVIREAEVTEEDVMDISITENDLETSEENNKAEDTPEKDVTPSEEPKAPENSEPADNLDSESIKKPSEDDVSPKTTEEPHKSKSCDLFEEWEDLDEFEQMPVVPYILDQMEISEDSKEKSPENPEDNQQFVSVFDKPRAFGSWSSEPFNFDGSSDEERDTEGDSATAGKKKVPNLSDMLKEISDNFRAGVEKGAEMEQAVIKAPSCMETVPQKADELSLSKEVAPCAGKISDCDMNIENVEAEADEGKSESEVASPVESWLPENLQEVQNTSPEHQPINNSDSVCSEEIAPLEFEEIDKGEVEQFFGDTNKQANTSASSTNESDSSTLETTLDTTTTHEDEDQTTIDKEIEETPKDHLASSNAAEFLSNFAKEIDWEPPMSNSPSPSHQNEAIMVQCEGMIEEIKEDTIAVVEGYATAIPEGDAVALLLTSEVEQDKPLISGSQPYSPQNSPNALDMENALRENGDISNVYLNNYIIPTPVDSQGGVISAPLEENSPIEQSTIPNDYNTQINEENLPQTESKHADAKPNLEESISVVCPPTVAEPENAKAVPEPAFEQPSNNNLPPKINNVENLSPQNTKATSTSKNHSVHFFEEKTKEIYAKVFGKEYEMGKYNYGNTEKSESQVTQATDRKEDCTQVKKSRQSSVKSNEKGKKPHITAEDHDLFHNAIEGPVGKPMQNLERNLFWDDNDNHYKTSMPMKAEPQRHKGKSKNLVSILKKARPKGEFEPPKTNEYKDYKLPSEVDPSFFNAVVRLNQIENKDLIAKMQQQKADEEERRKRQRAFERTLARTRMMEEKMQHFKQTTEIVYCLSPDNWGHHNSPKNGVQVQGFKDGRNVRNAQPMPEKRKKHNEPFHVPQKKVRIAIRADLMEDLPKKEPTSHKRPAKALSSIIKKPKTNLVPTSNGFDVLENDVTEVPTKRGRPRKSSNGRRKVTYNT